jgi:glycosyltransferase involved in cell wall biosynthesis
MLGLYGMPLPQLYFTGFETVFGEIAPRLVAAGHDVTIYCRASHYPKELRVSEYKGVKMKYVPSPGGKSFNAIIATWFASLHALIFGKYDLFFFVNVGMGHHAAVCRIFGAKVVMNVDGLEWERGKWGFFGRTYFKTAARSAVRFCNRLITDAEGMRQVYLERFHKDTTMIAYGAYVQSSTQPELIGKIGVEPGSYYLAVGRLVPENCTDLIISGFLASGSQKRLLVVGGANYESDFHRRLRALGTDRVTFTGHVNDQTLLKELYCNCFAYVHGHSVGGTNPALLSAMGYGTCILAHDTVFNREVLSDAGLYFSRDTQSLASLIRKVEEDPALVSELRLRGPKRIEAHYTWEKITGQYEDVFREVVGEDVLAEARGPQITAG